MKKFRIYYDIEKEEKFLNYMSSKGYGLTHYFAGIYTFIKQEPGKYTYRVDLIRDKSEDELSDYIDLIKESGGELIQRWGPWAFFKKQGEFNLYTDNESMIDLYSRIRIFFIMLGFAELCFCFSQFANVIRKPEYPFVLIFAFILFVTIVLAYQIIKCTKKINKFKRNINT